jgi:hypothetical protein
MPNREHLARSRQTRSRFRCVGSIIANFTGGDERPWWTKFNIDPLPIALGSGSTPGVFPTTGERTPNRGIRALKTQGRALIDDRPHTGARTEAGKSAISRRGPRQGRSTQPHGLTSRKRAMLVASRRCRFATSVPGANSAY